MIYIDTQQCVRIHSRGQSLEVGTRVLLECWLHSCVFSLYNPVFYVYLVFQKEVFWGGFFVVVVVLRCVSQSAEVLWKMQTPELLSRDSRLGGAQEFAGF